MSTSTIRRSTSSTRTTRRSTKSARATSATRQGFGKGRPRHVHSVPPAPDTLELGKFQLDAANKGDGITLLRTLPDNAIKTAFLDPQYPGGVKDWNKLRTNKNLIHKRRAELHQMSEATIAKFFRELSRVVAPSGHVFLWVDNFHVRNGIGQWLEGTEFETVDMITWHKNRMGLGQRSRSSAEFVVVLQKKPKRVKGCWTRRNIRSVWEEKVNAKFHTHAKPMELQKALIDATTQPGDLVLDPCAGSFSVMDAALATGRRFIGCDLDGNKRRPQETPVAPMKAKRTAQKGEAEVKTKTKRAVAPRRSAKATPAPKNACAARKSTPKPKPAAKTRRTLLRAAPEVARAGTSRRASTSKPATVAVPFRRVVRKREQARKLPGELLVGDRFVLVPLPLSVLNMLAANEALWARPEAEPSRRPRTPTRAQAGAAWFGPCQ